MQEPRKRRLQHRQLGTGHAHENDGKHPYTLCNKMLIPRIKFDHPHLKL